MNRTAILTLAAAVGAAFAAGDVLAQAKAPAGTTTIKVRIVADRYVVLDQHPLVMSKENGRITWELPPAPSKWRFQNDGVAIDGSQFLGCRSEAGGLKFTCVDKAPPRQRQSYPYRITVYDGPGNDAKSIFIDSAVQND